MKVGDVSQTSVLNDLFLPISRRRAKEIGIGEEEEARYVGRLSLEIDRSGALDKIAVGMYTSAITSRKSTYCMYARVQAASNITVTCASMTATSIDI